MRLGNMLASQKSASYELVSFAVVGVGFCGKGE